MSNLTSVRLTAAAEANIKAYQLWVRQQIGLDLSKSAAINALLEAAEIPRPADAE